MVWLQVAKSHWVFEFFILDKADIFFVFLRNVEIEICDNVRYLAA